MLLGHRSMVAKAWGRIVTVRTRFRGAPDSKGQTLVFGTERGAASTAGVSAEDVPKGRCDVSSAVALLELLARAAPARVVAADVLPLRFDDRARRARGRRRAAGQGHRRPAGPATPGGGDRIRAGEGLVLVREPAAVDGGRLLRALELVGLLGRKLRVEQRQDDLLVDREAELLEHQM